MLNNNYIKESILNKKSQDTYFTGTVSSLNPLKVKLYPGDDEIPVVATSNLLGIQTGSRLVLIKFQNQLIAIALIQNNSYPIGTTKCIVKANSDVRNNTTTLNNDSELTLTLPKNGEYQIDLVMYLDGVSTIPDIKVAYNTSNCTIKGYRTAVGPGPSTNSVYNANYVRMNSRNFTQTAEYGSTNAGWGTIIETSIVETSNSQGTLTVQHAQVTATAEDVWVRAGSWIKYTKIGHND